MGGNPDIFKMTIERKGKKVTLSGSEADADACADMLTEGINEEIENAAATGTSE